MLSLAKELEIFAKGFSGLAGVDEVGRGPWAGPVAAASVLVTADFKISHSWMDHINDSKKLSSKKRGELAEKIKDNFLVSISFVDSLVIDEINILQASLLAMRKSLESLSQKPDFALIDGKFVIPNFNLKQEAVIGGDALVFSIAAASIIAKVARDEFMVKLSEIYPNYSFWKHKGYGTVQHLSELKKNGPTPQHRFSFSPIKKILD